MKINTLYCLLFFSASYSQNTGVNNDNKWFFGAEIGANHIISIRPEIKYSVQGGIGAEYFFSRNWSLTGRLKYFETGVSNKYNPDNGLFLGAVVAVPIHLKRYWRIKQCFYFDVASGFSVNREVRSNYFYPSNEDTNFSKTYLNVNVGLGVNYVPNKKSIVYVNVEFYNLGNDRDDADWMEIVPNAPNNAHLNIGLKYSLGSIINNQEKL